MRYTRDYESQVGNARFEGYCVDLLERISKELDFEYELYLVPDGKYGDKDSDDKSWNGMVREIVNGVSVLKLSEHVARSNDSFGYVG